MSMQIEGELLFRSRVKFIIFILVSIFFLTACEQDVQNAITYLEGEGFQIQENIREESLYQDSNIDLYRESLGEPNKEHIVDELVATKVSSNNNLISIKYYQFKNRALADIYYHDYIRKLKIKSNKGFDSIKDSESLVRDEYSTDQVRMVFIRKENHVFFATTFPGDRELDRHIKKLGLKR